MCDDPDLEADTGIFNGILPLCDRAILRMLPITEDVDDFL